MTSPSEPTLAPSGHSSKLFMDRFAGLREDPAVDLPINAQAPTFPNVVGTTDAVANTFTEFVRARYTIERELGRGGMGIVLLGHDRKLDRHVAIKVLPRFRSQDAQSQRRFVHEARTVARLSHPHIVPLLDADEAGPYTYYTMAFVDGETLAERVQTRGRPPLSETLKILREVSWALAYSHASGVVHRDVKPENILIERSTGRALISDFGIAYRIGSARLTGDDQLLGTPLFMSPEQGSNREIDGRSDIYSLGVVGYWLVAGEYPFTAQGPLALLAEHASKPVPPLRTVAPHVPSAVAAVIQRCLAKRVEERFRRCEELAAALEEAATKATTSQGEPAPIEESEIASVIAAALALRSSLAAGDEPSADARIGAALATRLDGHGMLRASLFERLILVRPTNAEDLRAWAAAHGYLLPDQQHAAGADLVALLDGQEDARLIERLDALTRGFPPFHPLVHRFHLTAARIRCFRDSAEILQRPPEAPSMAIRLYRLICELSVRLVLHRANSPQPVVASSTAHPAAALHGEIMARVRENDGHRASKRLLDLARVLDAHRSRISSIATLVDRTAVLRARTHSDPFDDEWFSTLGEIIDHASALYRLAADEPTELGLESQLARGDISTARRRFRAHRTNPVLASPGITALCLDVSKSFAKREDPDKAVLRGISLDLRPGTITGVVGPNGSGKTTLLRIFAGQLAPSRGEIAYPQLDSGPTGRSPNWQRIVPQIGYVAQRPAKWYGRLADNLHRWAALHDVLGEENEVEVEFYLHRLGLAHFRDACWDELSGGYRTRFELARVMVARPRLLILDEPLAPLDINSQETFLKDLRDIADMDGFRIPILLSSQHILELEAIADSILCLDPQGRPQFNGPARALAGVSDDWTFELDGELSHELIDTLRHQVPLRAAYRRGERWIVILPADVPRDRLVRTIMNQTGAIGYLRDITHSCLKFFRSEST